MARGGARKGAGRKPKPKEAATKPRAPRKPKPLSSDEVFIEREPPPKQHGRCTYNRDIANAILFRLIEGASLRVASAENGIPSGTFCGWVVDDLDGLAERYTRARQIGAHHMVDEIVEMADDNSMDIRKDEETGRIIVDHDHISRSRLKVETRKWVLAKVLPKIYGEKMEVKHSGAIGRNAAELTDAELAAIAAGSGEGASPSEAGSVGPDRVH